VHARVVQMSMWAPSVPAASTHLNVGLPVVVYETEIGAICLGGDGEQAPPVVTNPLLQVKPHEVPLHVAVALAGGVHAVQLEVPQELTSELLAQAPEQRW
jgi:hypothetical protein